MLFLFFVCFFSQRCFTLFFGLLRKTEWKWERGMEQASEQMSVCVRVFEKEKGCERAPFSGITAKDRLEMGERDGASEQADERVFGSV